MQNVDWRMQSAHFGQGIVLAQIKLDLPKAQIGDVVTVALQWRTTQKLDKRYKVFVHIGQPATPPVAQNDSEPGAGFRPTDSWAVGEVIEDRRGVWLKPGTPPGTYTITLGLYDADTGERLNLADGSDRLVIGELEIRD
jgi:hypothetical protein